MVLGQTNQLLGGRKDVGLLRGKVRAGTRLPSSAPGGACQDASSHPEIWEALVRREVDKGNPIVQDALSGELLLVHEIKRRCN